jgi:hypothetical protein
MIDSLETIPIGSQRIEVLTGSHTMMLCHQQIRIHPLYILFEYKEDLKIPWYPHAMIWTERQGTDSMAGVRR